MKPMRSLVAYRELRLMVLTLLLIPALQVSAQTCSSPNTFIYGLTNVANVHRINTTNGTVGAAMNPAYGGNVPSYSNAMGYNNVNGKFYYFKRNSFAPPQEFVSFDPGLALITYLAPSPATASTIVNVGCMNNTGTGYYCIDANAGLFYYNIATNVWKQITANLIDQFGNNLTPIVNARIYGDAAFDGYGNLFFLPASATDFGLYKIKAPLPVNPVASLTVQQIIPPTTATPNGNSFGGIAFNNTGQIFISTNPPDDKLFRLNNDRSFTFLATFSVSGVGNDLTSCNFPFVVLPVSWESFTVDLNANNQAVIKWSVSQQSNNKGYYVEQSADGVNWETLAFVPNDYNKGGSAKYSFLQNKPVNGRHFYRIRQEDLDGNTSYSEIKIIDIKSDIHVELSPNPATDHIVIRIENPTGIQSNKAAIFDFSGKLIAAQAIKAGVNQIDISSFPKGSYFLKIVTGEGVVYHERFIKQ